MKKDDKIHRDRPDELDDLLAGFPASEQAALKQAWDLASKARPEKPDAASLDVAADRFQSTIAGTPPLDRKPVEPLRRSWTRRLRPLVAPALFLLGVTLGFSLRVDTDANPATSDPLSVTDTLQTYVVFIRGGNFVERTPEEQARIVSEFADWASELSRAGRLVAADQLANDGFVLRTREDRIIRQVVSRPADGTSGYFIIRAGNEREAETLAHACPQLQYGGFVEIRRIIN